MERELRQKEIELRVEKEILDKNLEARFTRSQIPVVKLKRVCSLPNMAEQDFIPSERILERVMKDLEVINMVATKSGRLKETFVRAFKDAANSIHESTGDLTARTQSEKVDHLRAETESLKTETESLKAKNTRLEGDMEKLRQEIKDLRGELRRTKRERRRIPSLSPSPPSIIGEERGVEMEVDEPLPPPPHEWANNCERDDQGHSSSSLASRTPLRREKVVPGMEVRSTGEEALMRRILLQVGDLMSARLAVIEARLPPEQSLRPPLGVRSAGREKTTPAKSLTLTQRGKRVKGLP